jgi:pimeloyl-ACP methyl ester carboxylesterase
LASLVSLPSFAALQDRLAPCKIPGKGGAQVDALCGTYEVWENREAKAGRKIGLKIVVLPALSPSPQPDPVFDLSGGPGEASTWSAGTMVKYPLRQERDLVFVDQRGTGGPDRLGCAPAGDLQSRIGELFPLDALRRCRDELMKKYDLTRYSVAAAVDDFDEIRAWLGYGKVNLFGSSYGTRTAQVYLLRHPEAVRTVTLWDVVPMDEPIALSFAASGQRALDLVLGRCEADAACHAKFPAVRKDFQAVMDRVNQGPVEIEVAHPETRKATRVQLSREVIADGIRLLLYSAESGAALPFLIHQAATGDWKPLADAVVAVKADLEPALARGMSLSVTCSQDFAVIDPAEVPARTAGSFLRDDRVRRQAAACALWPQSRIDPAEREPIHSDVPVLLVSGELDPVTPPEFGRRASRFLTQSLRVVEPHASHEESPPCVMRISDELIRRGTIQGLDTSCVSQLQPVPFLLEPPKEAIRPFSVYSSSSRLQPCEVPVWEFSTREAKPGAALCGSYEVWENRETKAGRKITLKIVVLPALSPSPLPDPVLALSGGPGGAATQSVYGSGLRQERDLVFIDQRGSGEPDRLGCALGKEGDLQGALGELFPLDAVRRCRDELGKKYDLARYSVAEAVDDFDEIVHWLGYGKVNLIGGSYGTRTAQVYLRRHPESVRTVILWGAVPMDEAFPLSHAAGAQRSLDLILGMCEKDAACHAKLPDPRKDFQAVMDRASQGPVEVEVADPKTKKVTRVRLSREVVTDGIRLILYSAESAAALPLFFHRAAAGDWKLLGQAVVTAKAGLDKILAWGLFFSVTCGQDIPFIDPAEVPARTAGTFFGDYRVRRQTAACALWPHGQIDPADREAIHSDVPVLLINGDLDPPADFGRRTARFLTRGLLVAEPYAGHEETPPCVEALGDELVRRGTTEGLDVDACVRQLEPVPFLLEPPEKEINPFG